MKTKQIQAFSLILLLVFYIYIESFKGIEPRQYHIQEQAYSPIGNMLTPIVASGNVTGTASISISPSPSFGPGDGDFS